MKRVCAPATFHPERSKHCIDLRSLLASRPPSIRLYLLSALSFQPPRPLHLPRHLRPRTRQSGNPALSGGRRRLRQLPRGYPRSDGRRPRPGQKSAAARSCVAVQPRRLRLRQHGEQHGADGDHGAGQGEAARRS